MSTQVAADKTVTLPPMQGSSLDVFQPIQQPQKLAPVLGGYPLLLSVLASSEAGHIQLEDDCVSEAPPRAGHILEGEVIKEEGQAAEGQLGGVDGHAACSPALWGHQIGVVWQCGVGGQRAVWVHHHLTCISKPILAVENSEKHLDKIDDIELL